MPNLGFSSPFQQPPSQGRYNPKTGTFTNDMGPSGNNWQTYAPQGPTAIATAGGPGQANQMTPGSGPGDMYMSQANTGGGSYGGQTGYGYGGQGGYGATQGGGQMPQQYNWGGQQQGGYSPNYNYNQVDRSALPQYPSGWNPTTQPGVSYINGKWQEVKSGADVTWDSGTNTYYWHGQPLTDSEYQQLATNGPQALSGQYSNTGFGQENTTANLQALGFGQPGQQVDVNQFMNTIWGGGGNYMPQAGQVGAPPTITAPTAQAGHAGFNNFDELQQAMYHQQFDPTQAELQRQSGLADERMAAQLAQAGISESGTGVAQRAFQSGEYNRQIVQASKEAATNATVQRYGLEYQQSLDNAKMQQETNLANANMNLQAQVANAQNILTAGVTNAQLATQASIAGAQIGSQMRIAQGQQYLAAIGLNFQQAHEARQDYLSLMGLQEQDLQRMDTSQLNWTSLLYNTYLQQWGRINEAGGASFGKTDATSNSMNIEGKYNPGV